MHTERTKGVTVRSLRYVPGGGPVHIVAISLAARYQPTNLKLARLRP